MLKIQEIREIIQMIDESSINEFSYEHEGSQIMIKKAATVSATPNETTAVIKPDTEPAAPAQVSTKSNEAPVKEETAAEENKETDENLTEIISPMVGTFYRKPTPESDTYVEVGDNVKSDSVVCIVEAMKLFNEIEAEVTGEVVEVLVSDGELVEYGQALFKVKSK